MKKKNGEEWFCTAGTSKGYCKSVMASGKDEANKTIHYVKGGRYAVIIDLTLCNPSSRLPPSSFAKMIILVLILSIKLQS